MSIYKKLNKIMKAVSYVNKDATVGYGKSAYRAVTRDAVVSASRQHFIDEGVLVITSQDSKGVSFDGTYKSGGSKVRFEALYDVSFVDIEDESKVTLSLEGHGEDNADKAPNKAATYAEKAAILKVLLLETGDEEMGEQTRNKISSKQIVLLQKMVTSTDTKEDEFLAFFNADTYADISEDAFTQAFNMLQRKEKKATTKKDKDEK